MLLTNISVAERINKDFPEIALIRKHDRPKQKAFKEAVSIFTCSGKRISKHRNYFLAREMPSSCIPSEWRF